MTGCAVFLACVLAPALAGASTTRPPVSLVASPSHIVLAGKARQAIRVLNSGDEPAVVDVTRAGFALDLRGRPRIVPRGRGPRPAAGWLSARPRRLEIAPGGAATLSVASVPVRNAEPGDHGALVLLTTRPRASGGLAVRMRIGIVVVVRVPGRIVHRLVPLGAHVRRVVRMRLVEVRIANRGNVTEVIDPRCLSVSLRRGGRMLTRLRPVARQLLPRTAGIVEARYRGPVRGRLIVRVEFSKRGACVPAPAKAFSIRL